MIYWLQCFQTCDWKQFLFVELNKKKGSISFKTTGGQSLLVKQKRFVNVFPNGAMKIFDVIYVLGFTKNLLFVSIMTEKWYITMFDDIKCLIFNDSKHVVG